MRPLPVANFNSVSRCRVKAGGPATTLASPGVGCWTTDTCSHACFHMCPFRHSHADTLKLSVLLEVKCLPSTCWRPRFPSER